MTSKEIYETKIKFKLNNYSCYLDDPYKIETNYSNPIISYDNIKNSLIKFKNEDEVIKIQKMFLENFPPYLYKTIMIDTESFTFNEYITPHMISPVISNINNVEKAFKIVLEEIESRMDLISNARVRNIDSYNQYIKNWNKVHSDDKKVNMTYITIFMVDAYSFINNNKLKDMLIQILLKSDMVGIKVLLFTKMNISNTDIGKAFDLLKIYNNCNYKVLGAIDKKKDNDLIFDDNMTGYEFEEFCKELLIANGFKDVEVTSASHDFGVDVIAYKDKAVKYSIQCKKYSSNVGVKAVQEVLGSMSMHKCHVGVVLTNNYFTKEAQELAEKNNILLWDKDELQDMIKKANI